MDPLRHEDTSKLLNNASISIHLVANNGEILWANSNELTVMGYQKDEYIGHNITEFHINSDTISDILTRLMNGEELKNYPAVLKGKDKSIYSIINSNVYKKDGEFVHTRCFTTDVSKEVFNIYIKTSKYVQ